MALITFDNATGKLEVDKALTILDTEAIYKWGARIVFEERTRFLTILKEFQKMPADQQTGETLVRLVFPDEDTTTTTN